jgi:hypothetical protein
MLEAICQFVGLPACISGVSLKWASVASLHMLSHMYQSASLKLNRKYLHFLWLQSWQPKLINGLEKEHLRELASQLDSLPIYN